MSIRSWWAQERAFPDCMAGCSGKIATTRRLRRALPESGSRNHLSFCRVIMVTIGESAGTSALIALAFLISGTLSISVPLLVLCSVRWSVTISLNALKSVVTPCRYSTNDRS